MERGEAVTGRVILAARGLRPLPACLYLLVWLFGVSLFAAFNRLIDLLLGEVLKEAKGKPCLAQGVFRHLAVDVSGGFIALLCMACGGREEGGAGFCLLLFFGILAVATVVDWKIMEIPDCLPIAVAVLSGIMLLVGPNQLIWASFPERLLGLVSVSLPMLLLALAIPGAFGGGDIKLMAACGVFLGWKRNLLALFFAILAGGLWGSWLLARKKAGRKDCFAFGPFLCLGMFVSVFWGEAILRWYCSVCLGGL